MALPQADIRVCDIQAKCLYHAPQVSSHGRPGQSISQSFPLPVSSRLAIGRSGQGTKGPTVNNGMFQQIKIHPCRGPLSCAPPRTVRVVNSTPQDRLMTIIYPHGQLFPPMDKLFFDKVTHLTNHFTPLAPPGTQQLLFL